MEKFETPKNLNGAELISELKDAGILVNKLNSPYIDGNNDMFLDILEGSSEEAKLVIKNHNGTIIPPEPTIAEKLASVGLSVADLKIVLGL